GYCFTVYPDRAALIENLIDWLAIPFPEKLHTLSTYSMPQPEEVISIAWKDSVRATKAFRIAPITPRQLKSTLAWIEALQWFASITHIQLSNQITHSTNSGAMNQVENISKPGTFSLRKTTQVIVCGDKKNIWGASGTANSAEVFSLSSVDRKALSIQIQNLL
ncbi:MAG TPA: hypothetical protein PLL95_18500, partial [Anaerolineales bacterium]|nr:hypothetical protein [Anaerolineales bacterium]